MAMTGGTSKLVSQGTPSGWPGPISLYVYYKEKSQSVANNQTVLSLGMYVTTPAGWSIGEWTDWNGSYVGTATSGANCKTFNGDIPNFSGTRWLVENQDITVTHDGNGSKNVTIYWHWGVNSAWSGVMNNPSGSFSVNLTTIPRASTIASVSNVVLGNPCNIKWAPKSASFRYKLKFSLGSWSFTTGVIHPNTTSEYTYTGYSIPLTVANQLPNASTGTMTVVLYTYSDSAAATQVGAADSKTFTATVPDNANTKPYATSMVLSPVSSLGDSFAGVYIQGYSKVKMTSSEQGQYGATVVWKNMTVENKSYGSSNSYTSDFITGYGNVEVRLTIQDSRGFVNTKTMTVPVVAYATPRVIPVNDASSVICARCDANGNLRDDGTYLKIKARRSYSLCMSNGVQKNFCGLRYRYKKAEDSTYSAWVTLLSSTDSSVEEVDSAALLEGALSVESSYVVQVDAVDSIPNHTSITFSIPTDKVYMHKAGNIHGLAIGKYAELSNTVDIAEDMAVKVRNSINGVFMGTKVVSGVSSFDIQSKYSDFTSTSGNERQTLFIFGAANASLVYGVARVSNNGSTQWQGTTGVTLSTKAGGILTVTLPTTAYDLFTVISSRKFTL